MPICNCTHDIIIFTLWHDHCAFSECIAYASSPNVWIEKGDFWGQKLYSRLHYFQKYKCIWNSTTGEELNYMRERTNTEDPYAVVVIRRRAVVGHVPQKMSVACALFLRRKGTIRFGSWHFSADFPQGGLEVPWLGRAKGLRKNEEVNCTSYVQAQSHLHPMR